MLKPSVRIHFEFGEARIVESNKGAGVMGGLREPGGMGLEGMGNLFGCKGWGIISGEVVSIGVGMTLIQVHIDFQRCDLEGRGSPFHHHHHHHHHHHQL